MDQKKVTLLVILELSTAHGYFGCKYSVKHFKK